jgi:hypothetical protein
MSALSGGWLAQDLQAKGWAALDSYRIVLAGYALAGVIMAVCFMVASRAIEVAQIPNGKRSFGLHKSRRVVLKLSALLALDAFAGGLIVQSMMAFWFHVRFGVEPGIIGSIFFRGQHFSGHFCAAGRVNRQKNRADQYNGIHAYSVKHSALARAAYAKPAAGKQHAACTFQHLTNGCANAPILYDGGGGLGRNRNCPLSGNGYIALADRNVPRHPGADRHAFLFVRRVENHL